MTPKNLTVHTITVAILLLVAGSAVAQPRRAATADEIRVLDAGTLEIDEFVVPHWAQGHPSLRLVVEDPDHLELGDAELTRLGSVGLWVVHGWDEQVDGDMAVGVPITFGLITTTNFDLTDDPDGPHAAALAVAVDELLALTGQDPTDPPTTWEIGPATLQIR